jgi:thioredoxin 1
MNKSVLPRQSTAQLRQGSAIADYESGDSCYPLSYDSFFWKEYAMSAVMELTAENFEEQVLKSTKPFLVDFWAAWCGPCRAVSPIVEEIAAEKAADILVGKLNVDEQKEIAQQYRVMSIPTLILFKDGEAAAVSIGAASKEELLKRLELNL